MSSVWLGVLRDVEEVALVVVARMAGIGQIHPAVFGPRTVIKR